MGFIFVRLTGYPVSRRSREADIRERIGYRKEIMIDFGHPVHHFTRNVVIKEVARSLSKRNRRYAPLILPNRLSA